MKSQNTSVSIIGTILDSFKIANQAFGSVVLLCVIVFLCQMFIVALAAGLLFLLGRSSLVALLLQIPFGLITALLNITFMSAVIQVIADRIDNTGFGAFESFKSSFVPSFYFIISALLLSIPSVLILAGAAFSKSILIFTAVYAALGFALLPFMFTQQALVLRGEGPISALRYSWQLGTANYGKILLTIFTVFAGLVVVMLTVVCACKAFLPDLFANPMMFNMKVMAMLSTSKASLLYAIGSWVLSMVFNLYFFIVIQAIITGLFINLDKNHFAPIGLDPVHEQTNFAPATAATPQTQSAAATAMPAVPPANTMPDMNVSHASVNTQPDLDTIQHLESVYNPQEHLDQAVVQEEDRMPTILFDEDMARQLEENERRLKQQQENQMRKQQDDGNTQTIKISK